MDVATIRIPRDKRDMLRVISSVERRNLMDIFVEMIDDYIERHNETMELLANPEWRKIIQQGKKEVINGIKGKTLDELDD